MSVLFVVAAALVDEEGRVLIQRRGMHQTHGGLWEFPGGKIEMGESPSGALARELAEELNLSLEAGQFQPCGFVETTSDARSIILLLFVCAVENCVPESTDGQALIWTNPLEMGGYPMPEADIALLPMLQTYLDARRHS